MTDDEQPRWQGLGRPTGPQRWTTAAPAAVPPRPPQQPAAPPRQEAVRSAPPPVPAAPPARRDRRGAPLAAAVVAALIAGGLAGGGVAFALDAQQPEAAPAPTASAAAPGSETEEAADAIMPSVVQVRTSRGSGSGWVLDEQGHVVTNHHVIEGASSVVLVTSTGRNVRATVVGSDEENDIAVLQAETPGLPAARIGRSASLRIGQPVIAVGSPLGLNGTVTSGIVSAVDRGSSASSLPMVQTDASINPGNSGGPLVDLTGRVVGVNTSIATLGSGNIGIGFAVPIDRAVDVAQRIIG
jgi:putative serine protease PepD